MFWGLVNKEIDGVKVNTPSSMSKPKAEEPKDEPRHKRRKTEDPLEPTIPGALLLQAMLRLPSPQVDVVLDRYDPILQYPTSHAHPPQSLQALSIDDGDPEPFLVVRMTLHIVRDLQPGTLKESHCLPSQFREGILRDPTSTLTFF